MKIVFATHNKNKLKEVREILGNNFQVLGLDDINCFEEIPEPYPTIEENAAQKSFYVYNKYGFDCFADDTGLEIEALNGEPGVYSARYAGENVDFEQNMNKVLSKMKGEKNRKARFKTVFSLVISGKEIAFEGLVNGIISEEKHGEKGFGYDPIFVPDGYDKSFAQMSSQEKNEISHRAVATKKLENYLKSGLNE